MRTIAFVLGLLGAVSSFAQYRSVEQEAQSVASLVQREGRYLSPAQRQSIAQKLEEIRRIVVEGGFEEPSGEYTCVSRDNDGRNPYVLGVRQGVQVTRISSAVFNSQNDCSQALNSARRVRQLTMLCLSRDNDGQNPYQLAILEGNQIARISRTIFSDRQSCQTTLNGLRPHGDQAMFCASRDNDGRSPYVALSLNLRSRQIQVGSESFQDVASCKRFLGQE